MEAPRAILQAPTERWHAPIHACSWFVFLGTSLVLGLNFTAPVPDWAAMIYVPSTSAAPLVEEQGTTLHVPMPKEVRGIYMTASKAASKKTRSELFAYLSCRRAVRLQPPH
jgi:hypothetical protein